MKYATACLGSGAGSMAKRRRKQAPAPLKLTSSMHWDKKLSAGLAKVQSRESQRGQKAWSVQSKYVELAICVAGIYAAFLSWAVLQERITTTPYETRDGKTETYDFPIFTNTIQSFSAFLIGYLYLFISSDSEHPAPSLFPSKAIIPPLALVSLTGTLASPFGYASLKHVGYITFILAKSCKLVPVMALQVTVFRRKYPFYKYLVVALVTAGVAVFTIKTDAKKASSSAKRRDVTGNASLGLLLLSINLLFDGLTNSTQDHINTKFAPYSGMQMMPAQNLIQTVFGGAFLFFAPLLAKLPLLGGLSATISTNELGNALAFVQRHPAVGNDLFAFALCGAIGQCFIFYTLARFSSLVLVTVTVTRKMLTMLLSVVWFGHSLSFGQWTGVGLVFGGVAAEAVLGNRQKRKTKTNEQIEPLADVKED